VPVRARLEVPAAGNGGQATPDHLHRLQVGSPWAISAITAFTTTYNTRILEGFGVFRDEKSNFHLKTHCFCAASFLQF
jgi:hypothetical protein